MLLHNSNKIYHTLQGILPFTKPYRLWLAINIIAAGMVALVDVLVGRMIGGLTDQTLLKELRFSPGLIGSIIGLILCAVLTRFIVSYAAGRFSSFSVRDMKNTIACHISRLQLSQIENRHSGDRISRLSDDASVAQGFLHETFPQLIFNFLAFLFTFLYMLTIDWKLLLLSIATTPITVFLTNQLTKPIYQYRERKQESSAKLVAEIQDAIGGAAIEKAYGLSDILYAKFKAAVDTVTFHALKEQRLRAVLTPSLIIIGFLPFITCVSYGGYLAVNGQISPGNFLSFLYLLDRLVDPLMQIPFFLAGFKSAAVSIKRLLEVLDEPIERADGADYSSNKADIAVQYDNVRFTYENGTTALRGISFAVHRQSTVALVGHSGCGKSTVLKLLLGFYRPESGAIRLYGEDIEQWNLVAARRQFSYVSQDTFLYPATVAENIAYVKPDATMDDIIDACKLANAHEFIMQLPDGYNTPLGERGVRLSGGQRQRIAIARAVLRNSPIMLLDEPTSALDTQSEHLVQEAIEHLMKDRTVIVVAHRLSTIKNADMVLVLDNGMIVEKGTHDELLTMNGVYAILYNKQLEQAV